MVKIRRLVPLLIVAFFGFVLSSAGSTVYASPMPDNLVYLGGTPVGITVGCDGLVASDYANVITENGAVCPAKQAGILLGDMLVRIEGRELKEVKDIETAINDKDGEVTVEYNRNGGVYSVKIRPAYDIVTSSKKLGLLVKNELAGVGTLTFVKGNGRFCTLGHQICDVGTQNYAVYNKGSIYPCEIKGAVKGKDGEAGALNGNFDRQGQPCGKVDKNNLFGGYGIAEAQLFAGRPAVEIGSKSEVKNGAAEIYTTIKGKEPKKYSIDIVKANPQTEAATRSMVIRVTDKELIEATGGIVQGMSGSPIIQNGKLIGAVTHVFLNDSTCGYGVYIDWLMAQ